MTAPIFQIGQEVNVTHKESHQYGTRFKITQIQLREDNGDIEYTTSGVSWYPASSLRLVEELKIGDLAEIIGDPVGIWCDEDKGHICEIVDIKEGGNFRLRGKLFTYPAKSLRKLAPDEIAQHTASKLELSQDTKDKIAAVFDRAVEREIAKRYPGIEARLSAIEKRQETQQNDINYIRMKFREAGA
ncbi:MAG: hypothetical protein PHS46_07925 [Candidatus Omnitrophica bacterium]|nr:hypothetical protein [Candidatus Omnitrophota bacterium]